MDMKKILLAAAALAFAGAASAQKTCTKADESNAQKAIDKVSTWASLNSTWKSFRHCDTGAVGEGFTDAILRLVVDWKGVNQLADAMARDADYKTFILDHLRSPEAKGDAPDVYSRAKANCPGGLAEWCKEIAAAVHEPPPRPATPVALPPAVAPQAGVPSATQPAPPITPPAPPAEKK